LVEEVDVAAESGERRAARMRALAEDHSAKAENYRRVAEAIEKGNVGEHKIATLLDVLDGAGWVVLNDRYKSAGSRANIDHILVGPPGVCVIDSKNWTSGRVRLDDRGMAVGKHRRDDELASAKAAAAVVSTRATQVLPGVITAPVLAFASDVGLGAPDYHQGVMCMQADQLLSWLTQQPRLLTPQQVHQVGSSLDAAFPPRAGTAKPLTTATLDRFRAAPIAQRRSPRPRRTAASRRPPVTIRPPVAAQYGLRAYVRHAALSAVHDFTSLVMRAALAIVLILLMLFVGLPLMTKLVESQMPKLLPSPAPSSRVVVPPAVGTGAHATPAPSSRRSATR
jgi:hypothetical protein